MDINRNLTGAQRHATIRQYLSEVKKKLNIRPQCSGQTCVSVSNGSHRSLKSFKVYQLMKEIFIFLYISFFHTGMKKLVIESV